MDYLEALAAIQGRRRFGVRLGLGRISAILRELGDPHRQLRGALIGGTNGKGSVLALAGGALSAAGYRVARTPKPHLVTYRERLVIGDRLVTPDAFAALVAEVLPVVERVGRRLGDPSEFEVLTALAFLWFARERVDLGLIEVGLGGRLDATNAWDGGVVAITNVDWDHMDRLGDTLEAIAREKAAIIKRGDRCVTAAAEPALGVIRRRARRVGVPLEVVAAPPVVSAGLGGLVLDLGAGSGPGNAGAAGTRRASWASELAANPLSLGLRGRHQAANAAVALGVLALLEEAGLARVPADAVRAGFADATWPGRLERLSAAAHGASEREVWLDGAHNRAGAAALAAALEELRAQMAPGPLTLILGVMGDKDVDSVLDRLIVSPVLRGARIITTRVDVSRALPADRLAERWRAAAARAGVPAEIVREAETPELALEEALAQNGGPVLVAGSLYLVGAIRARLVDDPQLRDPEEEG